MNASRQAQRLAVCGGLRRSRQLQGISCRQFSSRDFKKKWRLSKIRYCPAGGALPFARSFYIIPATMAKHVTFQDRFLIQAPGSVKRDKEFLKSAYRDGYDSEKKCN